MIFWNRNRWGLMNRKLYLSRELVLLFVIFLNSLGVTLMVKSGFGISSISSVPYIFAKAFDFLTLGTWNYLFQTMLVITLMVIKGRFEVGYMFSFVVGVAFGKMIDFHYMWLSMLPVNFGLQILYLVLGFICLAVGICFANNCSMPIIPTDIFPRDLSELTSVPYKKVKTIFDLSCLTVTVVVSTIILREITGIGIGTVICALTMGKAISMVQTVIDKRVIFKSYIFNRSLNDF